jgi:hypothetical protein
VSTNHIRNASPYRSGALQSISEGIYQDPEGDHREKERSIPCRVGFDRRLIHQCVRVE